MRKRSQALYAETREALPLPTTAVTHLKLLFITEQLPYGSGEAFVYPEIEWLLQTGVELRILPAFPSEALIHQAGKELTRHLLRETGTRERIASSTGSARLNSTVFGCRGTWVENCKKFVKNRAMEKRAARYVGAVADWKPDHIHAHWANYTATLACILSRVTKIPWSFTAHRYDIVFDNLFRVKSREAAFVRFISDKSRELARSGEILAEEASHEVIPMGVTLPSNAASPKDSAKIKAVIPASLIPVKGHSFLLEAISLLDEKVRSRLDIRFLGEGVLRRQLEEQILAHGLGGIVKLEGKVAHERILALYSSGEVDLVILPSVDLGDGLHEGIPVSLMEAMAYGIPVISTATGGITELVTEGAGILVPDKSATELCAAINRVASNPALRQRLGRHGRKRIAERFSVEVTSRRLLEKIREASINKS